MQICSGAGQLQRGAELFCLSLSQSLVRSGEEILLVTGEHPLITTSQCTVPMATVPEVVNPWLRKACFDYINPFAIAALRKHLLRFRPQIVHIHSLYGLSSTLVHTASRFCPTIITLHDAFFAFSDSGILTPKWSLANSCLKVPHGYLHRVINRRQLRDAVLVSPSKWLADFFDRTGFNTPRVIPNGIGPNGQQTNYENLILWVGALTNFKGLPSVIGKVAPLLAQSGWRFVVVGDGPYKKQLAAQYPDFEFVGYRDPIPYYEKASILVASSLGWENFPTVILEAMRHGVAVIGHDLGGVSELISHNRNGLLYQDQDDLIKHLNHLISNHKTIRSIGNCGRRDFLNNYQLETCVNRYLELYQSQLNEPSSASAPVSSF
jgi:glycosyltransferase involved in cell wall biosynthesis